MKQRQTDRELAALSRAVARRRNLPAVHLYQPLHQRKADSEPALSAAVGAIELREELEHVRQHFRPNADAVVADANQNVGFSDGSDERDLAALVRVLRGEIG